MEHRPNPEAHDGHRTRMRQRVQSEGFEGLKPHELIEFLLYYVIPRQDVNELAHRLIERFGSVQSVLEAEPAKLERVKGIGARTARWLALVGEATLACAGLHPGDRPRLRNCLDAFRYAVQARTELRPPGTVQLCLDPTGRLLYRRELCPSLSWGEPMTLREGLRDMLLSQANSSILLLLSERSVPEPEDYDSSHAADYAEALHAAGCELLDVILVGCDQLASLRKAGGLPNLDRSAAARALHEDYLQDMPLGALRTRDFASYDGAAARGTSPDARGASPDACGASPDACGASLDD